MDEKRREAQRPLVDALRELPLSERARAKQELGFVRRLGEDLFELGERCADQPGALAFTLMQTMVNGRRGFQLFVMNHETGEYVWHCNALTLGELGAALVDHLEGR